MCERKCILPVVVPGDADAAANSALEGIAKTREEGAAKRLSSHSLEKIGDG